MTFKKTIAAACVALGMSTVAASAVPISFSWTSTPTVQSQSFSIASIFELVLGSYTGVGSEQTGFILADDQGNVFTTQSTACVSATPSFPTCNLVTGSTADGTILLTNVPAGTYTLSIYDSATPISGSIAFAANAIPLPAAGLMLLSALGMGVLARRKRTAA